MKVELNNANSCELTVIVPMYNEGQNIDGTFSSIKNELKDFHKTWEIIFVNDGSTDDSYKKAQELQTKESNLIVLSYPTNMGRGKALRTGFNEAHGRYIVTIDFDLSYSADHILKLYNELKNDKMLDIVLASPYMPGGKVENVPPFRLLISRMGNLILRKSFQKHFHTVTSITRGYTKKAISSLSLESNGKEIHLEIISKALAIGLTCREIPATLRGRQKGNSKFRFARTSITHLMFSLFERPILMFMLAGFCLLSSGIVMGVYITYLRFTGTLNIRPLIDLVVLLIVLGVQFISFGVLAGQNGMLRKEIYKLQSTIKNQFNKSNSKNEESNQ